MSKELSTFKELVEYLSRQYGVPTEIIEAIIVEWVKVLYLSTTGRNADDDIPPLLLEGAHSMTLDKQAIRKRHEQRVFVYGEPEPESPLGDTEALLAEVERLEAQIRLADTAIAAFRVEVKAEVDL